MNTRGGIVAAVAAIVMLTGTAVFARGLVITPELLDTIKPGVTTAQEVEQLFGSPRNRSNFPWVGLTSMDYVMVSWNETYDVGVLINKDGIVHEVQRVMRIRGFG